MTTKEIIAVLKEHWGIENDNDLVELLGVSKQTISNYQRRKTVDVQTKIIIKLLSEVQPPTT